MNNEYIITPESEHQQIEIYPKLRGGTLNIHFQNVHGMPTKKQNRQKLKEFEQNIKGDINILQETACVQEDEPWPALDDYNIVVNNKV